MNSNNDAHDNNADDEWSAYGGSGRTTSGKGKEEDTEKYDPIHELLWNDGAERRTPNKTATRWDEKRSVIFSFHRNVLRDSKAVASDQALLSLLQQALATQAPREKVDGEHSDSPGAGPCGRKHWYEGREVDIVSKFMGRMIGFNITDNPLLVAKAFVAKHNLNPQSTDNTALVSKVADSVREMCNESLAKKDGKKSGAESLDLDHLIEEGAHMNPYSDEAVPTVIRPHGEAGGITAVYNHHTKQVDVFHYASDVDAESIKRREEEAKKRATMEQEKNKAKKRKDQELEEARKKVEQMKQEKQHRDKPQTYVVQPKNPAAVSGGMATLNRLQAGAGAAAGGASGGGAVMNGGGGGGGGGAKRKESSGREALRLKAEWDNGYAAMRFRKVGAIQFIKDMEDASFTQDEKELVLTKMPALLQSLPPGTELGEDDWGLGGASNKEVHKFAGQGHSMLGGSHTNNNNNGDNFLDDSDEVMTEGAEHEEEADTTEVVIDRTQSVTQLRVQIPGRQPLTAQFNLTHTVQDIRRYINRHAPVARGYHLQLLRPPRRLQPGETIEQAQLQQSSIQLILM